MKDSVPVKIKQSIEKPPYSLPFSATGILHGYAAGRSPTAAAGQPVYPFLTVNDRGQPPSRQLSGRKAQKYEIKIVNSHDRDPGTGPDICPHAERRHCPPQKNETRKNDEKITDDGIIGHFSHTAACTAARDRRTRTGPEYNTMAQRSSRLRRESGHGRVLPLLQSQGCGTARTARRTRQILRRPAGHHRSDTREGRCRHIVPARRQPSYRVGYDGNGSVFSAFSARYVPYSVIYDKRGRILWVGNPSSLSAADVADIIH